MLGGGWHDMEDKNQWTKLLSWLPCLSFEIIIIVQKLRCVDMDCTYVMWCLKRGYKK